jgi:hypothetical protein
MNKLAAEIGSAAGIEVQHWLLAMGSTLLETAAMACVKRRRGAGAGAGDGDGG